MRQSTQAQRDILRGVNVAYDSMVWVERSDAWQNMNTLGGVDWVSEVEVETSVDQPIWTATVRMLRETHPTNSLAPLMGVSDLNKLGGAIAQALWVGRRVRCFVAARLPTSPATVMPAPSDDVPAGWIEMFHGYIQELEWGSNDEIVLHAHDLGAKLLATTMLTEVVIADMTIEEAIPHILQNNGMWTPLYTPVSPNRMITRIELPRTNVMEAIRSLAHEIGWEVRYKYDANQVSRLTLYRPSPPNSLPVQQFGPTDYVDIRRLNVSLAPVRTVVRINYNDRTTLNEAHVVSPALEVVASPPAGSPIAKYGIRLYERTFDASSNIRTRVEALTLADIIRSDVEEVYADKEVEMWLWWPAEPSDYYGFDGNNVHYDSIQNHGVVAVRHRIANGDGWTSLTTRGAPVVFYRTWLRDDDGPRGGSTVPTIYEVRLQDLNLPGGKVVHVTLSISRAVAQWKMWARKGAWPTTNGQQYAKPSDDYLRIFGTRDNVQARVAAKADETWYVIAIGYNEEGVEGAPAFATITTLTGDPPGGAVGVLFNLGHYFNLNADGWGSIALTWNHNQVIQDAGAGEYVVDILRGLNETLRTSRNPALEENGMDSIDNYGAWVDNLYVRQTAPPPTGGGGARLPDSDEDGSFKDVTYKLVLRRNGAVVQTDYQIIRLWTADEI
jgi:hypothetical protein